MTVTFDPGHSVDRPVNLLYDPFMPFADGADFAGYTIERLLGTGGMGEVYLVRHPRLPRQEALKILPASVSADPDYRKRFAREADVAASLWHPHVVAVHDRGEHDGQLWITMDYVEGTDASRLVRERYPLGMPAKEVLDIVSAVAAALDYAHDSGLLHRDVKPANILLTQPHKGEPRILLADFGIARAANESDGLTATNMTVGSVAYAAPEQLVGRILDGRADQYALACTAFHLLTGAPPFANSNPAVVIGNHLSEPVPAIADIRHDVRMIDDVIAKAMSKDPNQRFASCAEFALELERQGMGRPDPTTGTQPAMATSSVAPPTYRAFQSDADASSLSAPSDAPTQLINTQGSDGDPRPRRITPLIAGGIAVLVAVGIVAFIGARLGQSPASAPGASPSPTPSYEWPETYSKQTQTITQTAPPVTVTKSAPPRPAPKRTPPPAPPPPSGDLGLTTPMSYPYCSGQGIVVLGSVTTPGLYAAGVQQLLDANPGSYYLRTDLSCPSLRQATEEGNPIYAVFQLGGTTERQVCAGVVAAGGIAYGKWLDYTTDPGYVIPC